MVYIFIKIINPQNFLYICWMKYLVNRPIFHKFYMQSAIISAANKYSSAGHHEQKNKNTGQIKFSAVTVKQ